MYFKKLSRQIRQSIASPEHPVCMFADYLMCYPDTLIKPDNFLAM